MLIGGFGAALLITACGILPYLAWKSARVLGKADIAISRRAIFVQVISLQVILFVLGLAAARENYIEVFRLPSRGAVAWIAAAALLAIMVTALKIRWSSKEEQQKRRLYSMLPRNGRERALYVLVCVAAGVAEELVYRGVVPMLLLRLVGNYVVAVILAAIAFAIAHSVQGWRAVGAVFLIAIGAQALVVFTESLIPAMTIHAAYDLIAGILVPRWFERDAATSLPTDAAAVIDQ
jgi:membrane protease YdiL (CAAX protease family)